ncbi:MAG: type II toxin-antitoxin system VapC family toxin [Acidobacteria bacterium]|nr:type II toxin-antitoxin system VapC family toxin [Acidobacteriota bacterium]
MKKYVLDASALLRYVEDEPGAGVVLRVFQESRDGQAEVLMSAVNWGEVTYVIVKVCGGLAQQSPIEAGKVIANLRKTPLRVVSADIVQAEAAAMFKTNFNVPYADAFAGSLALRESAILVTADFDFKNLSGHPIQVEFLPRGKKGAACAGINRHVVGDERALQESRSDSILTLSLAPVAVRRQVKRRQRHRWAGLLSSEN